MKKSGAKEKVGRLISLKDQMNVGGLMGGERKRGRSGEESGRDKACPPVKAQNRKLGASHEGIKRHLTIYQRGAKGDHLTFQLT